MDNAWKYIGQVNFDLDIDFFLGHCTFVDSVLDKERSKVKRWYEKATKNLTEEQKEQFYERHGDEGYYTNELFPSIQWSAMFVAGFNLFEKTLNDACSISASLSESSVHLKDLAGSGIQRAKSYLSKVHDVHGPFRTEEWRRVQDYAKVRNVLAHTYGELDLKNDAHKEVLKIASKTKGITISRQDQFLHSASIVVDESIVFEAIATYRKIIGQVHKAFTEKANQAS